MRVGADRVSVAKESKKSLDNTKAWAQKRSTDFDETVPVSATNTGGPAPDLGLNMRVGSDNISVPKIIKKVPSFKNNQESYLRDLKDMEALMGPYEAKRILAQS